MAFDQSTRNRLQKFVSESRSILNEEFTRQLQAIYGMDPKSGSVADLASLSFLDNQGRQTAMILRETLEHYKASLAIKSEKERNKQGIERIIREQSFTVLNRLGALRMAEARGFLLESVAKGYSSKGFQLYKNLAGTALGETGDAYRQYLFSIFDEFSQDLAVLFDRNSSQGLLFPRESALLSLLDQINHFEIESLWAEDETIGWIYQYFNSQEERKKMRAESQAPRNSRELAVRNQFFTPRYVVEFLTDNTLGRIWYEMTQGKTALSESCRYLVRRPNEIFLAKGESAPVNESKEQESLTQEELLKQPVYIPFRELKDPRELRMLDPACGSMHFGLYAFDLFEEIYKEAWQLEIELGPELFNRSKGMKSLQETYPSFGEFCIAVPNLIIEYNIHGVDIDPRAVQIAGLSLWQRAQRSWYQMGTKPNQRPAIKKSNIVCAEPMPGEKEMLLEFTGNLNPPILGQLVETIFDKMELAGEAGTLLKIEEEIASSINIAKNEFNKEILRRKEDKGYFPGMAPKREPTQYDFAELSDETSFWDTAEERILEALSVYANQAESGDGLRRLFSEDAAKGFAFIDLCRRRFDVILMNPPFGSNVKSTDQYIKNNYQKSYYDLYSAFITMAMERLNKLGKIGALTSKTFFSSSRLLAFREEFLRNRQLDLVADLGLGVLDNATVETAAYTLQKNGFEFDPIFYNLVDNKNFENGLLESTRFENNNYYSVDPSILLLFPNSTYSAYWAGSELIFSIIKFPKLDPNYSETFAGQATGDDFRFVRAFWEIPENGLSSWRLFAKGGDYSRYYSDWHLLIDWSPLAVSEYKKLTIRSVLISKRSKKYLGRPALVWSRVNDKGFNVRVLPAGALFSDKSPGIFAKDEMEWLLGYLSSELIDQICTMQNPNRMYELRDVSNLPISESLDRKELSICAREIFTIKQKLNSCCEPSTTYLFPLIHLVENKNLQSSLLALNEKLKLAEQQILFYQQSIDLLVKTSFSLGEKTERSIYKKIGNQSSDVLLVDDVFNHSVVNKRKAVFQELSYCMGILNERWKPLDFDEDSLSKYLPDIFDPYSLNAPAMLSNDDSNIADPYLEDYSNLLPFATEGIMANDETHSSDILTGFLLVLGMLWGCDIDSLEQDICDVLKEKNLRSYLNKSSGFFSDHLKNYSKSRRQSPIYWPLQTPTGSYTLWVYFHRLTDQTLYACINNFIEPKLKAIYVELSDLRSNHFRSSSEEKEMTQLSDIEAELKDFRDSLLQVAKFWKPHLNDGVQITAAPLWKFFQHKQWQKKLKETWDNLEKGEYDWAHMAFNIWPERVLRKCHEDRSLAIAHDVENDFWEEVEIPVIRRGKDTGETKVEWQPKKLNEDELKGIITQKIAELR